MHTGSTYRSHCIKKLPNWKNNILQDITSGKEEKLINKLLTSSLAEALDMAS